MRIASGINPNTQRTQASTVKLLASTLLNLDGDESEVRFNDAEVHRRCHWGKERLFAEP